MFEHSVPKKWDDDDDDDEDEGSANQIFKGSANLPTQCSCGHTASLPRVANLQRVAIQGRVQSRMRRARGELGDFKQQRLGFHGISIARYRKIQDLIGTNALIIKDLFRW